MQGCIINTDSIVGENCIINTGATIDHDCIIKDHTHICPGVVIAGNVKIGKNCWIGLGSKIIENCVIGDNVFVAAGSVVINNIKSNSFVKGIPAKYARKNWPNFNNKLISKVIKIIKSGNINYTYGEYGNKFEKEFSKYIGNRYSVAMCNGTAALEVAIKSLGIPDKSEIIVPARSFFFISIMYS